MVDDEENIRKALINSVNWEELGFEIVGEASNGIEALELIEQLSPDLLVSDIKMPLMGGIELARAVREMSPNIQMVFLSGYDHFKFAKEAIRYNIMEYLLKPISPKEIIKEFTNIREQMDKKFGEILDVDNHLDILKEIQTLKKDLLFTNLLHRNINQEQVGKSFQDIEVSVPSVAPEGSIFAVCVVKCEEASSAVQSETDIKRLLNISNIVSKKYFNCECLIHKNYVVICMCDTESAIKKYMRILTKDIVLSAKRVMNMQVYIGQSENFANIMQLSNAFFEGREAVASIEKTDEHIVAYGDILRAHQGFSITDMVVELESKIKHFSTNEVKEALDEIFSYINESKVSPADFGMCILELQLMLNRARRYLEDDSNATFEVLEAFTFSKSRQKIENDIRAVAIRISESISNQRKKAVDSLSENAVSIIKKEFANSEISLNMLSERLHCSPNYLSGLIKKNIGKSFVDILTETRMIKAKEILISTNKKIMEISEEVGYSDQHYFSYSFKKYFNQSPNQMRKNET